MKVILYGPKHSMYALVYVANFVFTKDVTNDLKGLNNKVGTFFGQK